MSQIPIPTSTEAVIDPKTGHMRASWHQFLDQIRKRFATAEGDLAGRPVTTQQVFGSWLIETPEDKDYRLIVNSPYAVTWTSVTTIATAGTATATVKIGSTPLGGTANSVSTSEQAQAHSSANAMAAGDDLVLTLSGVSNCEGLSITIAGTQELATE